MSTEVVINFYERAELYRLRLMTAYDRVLYASDTLYVDRRDARRLRKPPGSYCVGVGFASAVSIAGGCSMPADVQYNFTRMQEECVLLKSRKPTASREPNERTSHHSHR